MCAMNRLMQQTGVFWGFVDICSLKTVLHGCRRKEIQKGRHHESSSVSSMDDSNTGSLPVISGVSNCKLFHFVVLVYGKILQHICVGLILEFVVRVLYVVSHQFV